MAGVVFAVVVILSFAIETKQENITGKFGDVDSAEIQNNATDEIVDSQESKVIYLIRTITAQADIDPQAKNGEPDESKTSNNDDLKLVSEEDSNEKTDAIKIERTDAKELIESDQDEGIPDNDRNYTQKKYILDSLSKIFNRNHHRNKYGENIILDMNDNEHLKSNDDDQDDATNIKVASSFSKFGAILDMKGRSGLLRDEPEIDRSRFPYLPNARRGIFLSPGFFKFPSPPALTFSKIDNRDILTIGNLNNLPYRRYEIPVSSLRRIESLETANGDIPTSAGGRNNEELALDSNAYQYEPDYVRPEPALARTTMSYRHYK